MKQRAVLDTVATSRSAEIALAGFSISTEATLPRLPQGYPGTSRPHHLTAGPPDPAREVVQSRGQERAEPPAQVLCIEPSKQGMVRSWKTRRRLPRLPEPGASSRASAVCSKTMTSVADAAQVRPR